MNIFNQIENDYELLNLMVEDAENLEGIYKPGPYWADKIKLAVKEIKKFGLSDFRGYKNGLLTSFGDNAALDTRTNYNFGIRSIFKKINQDIYPFNRMFNSQVKLTYKYFYELNDYKNIHLTNSVRVKNLIQKYKLNFDTTRGGCLTYLELNGNNISHHYLQLLDTLDSIDNKINISNKKTFFEIGGGFGVNTHLIIELFKIKKIVYLDIAPNLYVGTQYLKSFYGERVFDYRKCKNMDDISFSDSDELEIYCITPDQIDKINSRIDLFHNAHSFVEMPENVIRNYAKKIESILSKNNSAISLVSYDGFDLESTIHPDKLPNFFHKSAARFIVPTLTPLRSNFHYIIE
jgi:putative sugar O-methyltransferase